MQRGEWWIDEDGMLTFADGDVGDWNHETIAFYRALNIPVPGDGVDEGAFDWPENFPPAFREIVLNLLCEPPLKPLEQAALRAYGSPPRAIAFFSSGQNADARDYAIRFMRWIRVKDTEIEVWEFNDDALKRINGAEFWDEEDEQAQDLEITVNELSTGAWFVFPAPVLLQHGATTAGLKAWAKSPRAMHRQLEGLRRQGHGQVLGFPYCPCRPPHSRR